MALISTNVRKHAPKNVQVTPEKFLVFNGVDVYSMIRIENSGWATYEVHLHAPQWIKCDRKYILDAQSSLEIDMEAVIPDDMNKNNFTRSMSIHFIDLENSDRKYMVDIQLQYSPFMCKISKQKTTIVLLQLSLILLILTIVLLVYHYRFQLKYYLCVFKHIVCKLSPKGEEFAINKIFRCF